VGENVQNGWQVLLLNSWDMEEVGLVVTSLGKAINRMKIKEIRFQIQQHHYLALS